MHECLHRKRSPIFRVTKFTDYNSNFSVWLFLLMLAILGMLRRQWISLLRCLKMYWLPISLILAAKIPILVSSFEYFPRFFSSEKIVWRYTFYFLRYLIYSFAFFSYSFAAWYSYSRRSMLRLISLPLLSLNLYNLVYIASSAFVSLLYSYSTHLVRIRRIEASCDLNWHPSIYSSVNCLVPAGILWQTA